MTSEVITGWPTVPLGTVLTDMQPGFASGKHNSTGEGVPHFRPMNVSTDGRIERKVLKYVDPTVGRPELRLRKGDVVFNNTNSPELVGKTAIFEHDDAPAFSNHMTRLRPNPGCLDPRYLALRLHQAWREGWFAAHCNNHVSQASIGRDALKAFEIELPPIAVQQVIAAQYSQFDVCRASGSDHLAAAQKAMERFRRAVLIAAYSGHLTEQWRSRREPTESSADWQRRLLKSRQLAVNTMPLAPFLDTELPAIPEGWQWSSADSLTTVITKGTTPSASSMQQGEGEIPYLKVYNLTFDGAVDFTVNPTFIPRTIHAGALKRSRVFPGDLLLNIVGPPLGKVGVVPEIYSEWNINQAIAIFRPVAGLDIKFLKLWLLSPQLLSHLSRRAKATAGQYNLTLQICRELPVPIPPPEEQAEIVRRASRMLVLADELLARIEVASRTANRSSQAVLAKAFRGDLTAMSRVKNPT